MTNQMAEARASYASAEEALATLDNQNYIQLTTFRRNGSAVPTPVWFARDGQRLYVTTAAESWKVKRIRNNPTVQVAASTATGEALTVPFRAVARILPEAEADKAARQLREKYGLLLRLFFWYARLRRQEHLYLEIVPQSAKPVDAPGE